MGGAAAGVRRGGAGGPRHRGIRAIVTARWGSALRDGRLWRAALDVFQQEPTPAERWADVPNAVLTTHTAGSSNEAVPLMVAQAIDNVQRFLAGEALASPVAQVAG